MSSAFDAFSASYSIRKWGVFAPFTALADGTGILQGVPFLLGTAVTYGLDPVYGTFTEYETSSTINHPAGYHGYYLLTNASFNPIFRCKFSMSSIADCRLWVGFSETAGPTSYPAGDDAFNGISGFALSMRANETNYQIAHNDGTGATVFDDVINDYHDHMDNPVPVNTDVHTIEIAANINAASPTMGYSLDRAQVQTIDADIPLAGDNLTFTMCIENSAAVNKKIRIYYCDILSDK